MQKIALKQEEMSIAIIIILAKLAPITLLTNLSLGTKISLTESFDLDFRYQFMDLGKYKTGSYKIGQQNFGSYKDNLRTSELMAGIAYKF